MKIDHIAMYVNDLEGARQFFMKFFNAQSNEGYTNHQTSFKSYFLTFDDGSRLEIMNKQGMIDSEKSIVRTGFIHLAFNVGSKEKVDELTERLKVEGFNVISGPRTTGDGYYESCIIGFEENQFEITI